MKHPRSSVFRLGLPPLLTRLVLAKVGHLQPLYLGLSSLSSIPNVSAGLVLGTQLVALCNCSISCSQPTLAYTFLTMMLGVSCIPALQLSSRKKVKKLGWTYFALQDSKLTPARNMNERLLHFFVDVSYSFYESGSLLGSLHPHRKVWKVYDLKNANRTKIQFFEDHKTFNIDDRGLFDSTFQCK